MRNISDKSCRENHNTHFIFNNSFSDACALRAGYQRLQTHRIFNTYCFSTATVVTRTRLNAPFIL